MSIPIQKVQKDFFRQKDIFLDNPMGACYIMYKARVNIRPSGVCPLGFSHHFSAPEETGGI